MAEASRTKSLVQEQMEDNAILRIWTQKQGLIIRPAYGIDKLCFSIIEKGAGGKGNSFDVYAECLKDGAQCIDDWAYDILHDRRFERVLAEEAKNGEKYPKGYKIVTGASAEKSVGIANSQTAGRYVINVVSMKDGKKVYANIPVTFNDLRRLAERFLISYKPRKMQLEEIRKAAAEKNASFRKREEAEAVENPGNATVPEENSASLQNTAASEKPEETSPAGDEKILLTTGPVKKSGHVYYVTVLDKSNGNKETNLCFREGEMDEMLAIWEAFKEKAPNGVALKLLVQQDAEKNCLWFKKKIA